MPLDAIFEELFDAVSKQIQCEKEKLLSEIRQEMRQLRSRMRSAKCEGCGEVIRQAYNYCKYRCDALRGRVALSHREWESIFNNIPIYSFKCHECVEYDWSRRGKLYCHRKFRPRSKPSLNSDGTLRPISNAFLIFS